MKKKTKKKTVRHTALWMALCLMFVTSCGKTETPGTDLQADSAAEEDSGAAPADGAGGRRDRV